MAKRDDHRSVEATVYRKLYKLAAWRARRLDQLTCEPLCLYCIAAGIVEPATIADHVIPHRGDLDLFWHGELASLCKLHHDSTKQREEKGGYDTIADLDGYPIDPRHPSNQPR